VDIALALRVSVKQFDLLGRGGSKSKDHQKTTGKDVEVFWIRLGKRGVEYLLAPRMIMSVM